MEAEKIIVDLKGRPYFLVETEDSNFARVHSLECIGSEVVINYSEKGLRLGRDIEEVPFGGINLLFEHQSGDNLHKNFIRDLRNFAKPYSSQGIDYVSYEESGVEGQDYIGNFIVRLAGVEFFRVSPRLFRKI